MREKILGFMKWIVEGIGVVFGVLVDVKWYLYFFVVNNDDMLEKLVINVVENFSY